MNKLTFNKNTWYIVSLVAEVITVAAFVLYLVAGTTQFDPNYSVFVIVGSSVAVAAGIVALVWGAIANNKFAEYVLWVQYLFSLMATLGYLTANANLYGNIFMGLDGGTLPIAFFVLVVLYLAQTVLSAVSAKQLKKLCSTNK